MTAAVADLRARIAQVTLRDERRLRRRLNKANRYDDAERRAAALAAVANEVDAAERYIQRRRGNVPPVTYPPALPITARVDDLSAAIREHQVVVVAGETGSGKTTQLPKICVELGRGVRGMIGHTQPRRLAARTVAERIADELDVELGGPVGYEYRFNRRISDNTLVSVMTDGILLAGIQADPALAAYDTLIIDEAHERSLNIDFLIGYVTQLLPRRPDLHVIITSATIDPERFSRHFDDAPIVEVSGRMYPVDVRYRPLDGDDTEPLDQTDGIAAAVTELSAEEPGDILVFLSGEREIRDTGDALSGLDLADTEILPLYSRLAPAQQRAVFQPHPGRRIVLATNVAETSLTVPGIRYVIDPGYARISRYSARLKVQRLPIERISQASADQRAGRCGRTADGVCIRLYSQEDYAARPRFTEPEILRTNLGSVLLAMAALRLGDIDHFGFLDPPDRRQVRDGLALLHELGAIAPDAAPRRRSRPGHTGTAALALTPVGRTLSRLPLDPRLGRMVIEADRNNCLDEVLVITAALSIPDPRLRPTGEQQAADALHARFAAESSDFITWLHLWRYVRERRDELSSNQFRKLCRAEHLHYLRVREWQDLHAQLRRVSRDLGMRCTDERAEPDVIHRSLLAGLLSHIGLRDGIGRDYRGARGAKFAIQPGSVLFKRSPQWIVAAELVETSRLWARTVARITPQWAEQLADHLVTRAYSDPWWDAGRGQAVAHEGVRLYGLPLVTARTVDYAAVDAAQARALFIRHALVEGDWLGHHEFWRVNRQRIEQAHALEDKLRRRDVVVDDDTLFAFYDARVGADVTSTRHFDGWWKRIRRRKPHLLDLPWDVVLDRAGTAAHDDQFPDHWRHGDLVLPVSYRFEPGAAGDGVTVDVPLAALNRVDPARFEWLVPGLRTELVTELLRTLPKDVRRRLVPIPDTARAVLDRIAPAEGPVLGVLSRAVRQVTGVTVAEGDWRPEQLPDHLRVRFRVTDDGREIAADDDLSALRQRLAPRLRARLTDAAGIERSGLTSWTFGELPRTVTAHHDGHALTGFPGLVDDGDRVAVRVLGSQREQTVAMWTGTRRLLLLNAGSTVAQVTRRLDTATKLALTANPHGSVTALIDDVRTATVDELMRRHGAPVWSADAFAALLARVRGDLDDALVEVLTTVAQILSTAGEIDDRLAAMHVPGTRRAVNDMTAQLRGLVHAGFVTAKSVRRLDDVARYLQALRRRLDTVARDPDRDRDRMDDIVTVVRAYRERLERLAPPRRTAPDVLEIAWMIEELRVALFAQSLGTAHRVSPERVLRAIGDLPD